MEEMDNLEVEIFNDKEMMNRIKYKLELKSYKYKDLCVLLGEKAIDSKNSHGKSSQLKRWQRFFEFEKKGHSIIITIIYDTPIHKVENRGGNKPFKYLDELEYILVDYLENTRTMSKEMPINLEPAYIMKIIGMINFNYYLGNKYRDELSHYLKMDKKIINDFYASSNSEFIRIIVTTFDKLLEKGIIKWRKTYRVNYKDDKGCSGGFEILNEADYKYVQEIEKDRIEYMGLKDYYQVISLGKIFDFKRNVITMLNNEMDNDAIAVVSYSKVYSLQLLQNDENAEYAKVMENTKQLNVKTTQRIKDKVNYIYENFIEEESNIGKEEYIIGNKSLIEYMFDLVEYDMIMCGVLNQNRNFKHRQSKYNAGKPIIKYVTKKKNKEIEIEKLFKAENDSLWTTEEDDDLFY